ncbi:hypothetical protein [Parablautia sp. Marseille-Q6255]|uniref:hypothetical protein n=1 Tax=Parablautia sp. Marseille-Q6255 TaxID=3039593 RepID=UPI003FA7EE54
MALISMLMDHIYYFFGYTNTIPWWFGLVGRLAAPPVIDFLTESYVSRFLPFSPPPSQFLIVKKTPTTSASFPFLPVSQAPALSQCIAFHKSH